MKSKCLPFIALLFVGTQVSITAQERVADPDPARFASSIEAFAKEDKEQGFKKGGIVFVGSSSIRMLDIPKIFPGLEALNRGFGGSHISDLNHYIEQTVLKYQPKTTVFFCGGNDLWSKKSPMQVLEDFREFRDRLFARVPQGKLIVLATRPSPQRHTAFEIELALNYLMEIEAMKDDRILFLRDSCDRFFDEQGNYFSELYAEDQLHMSAKGYDIWKKILTPHLVR